MKKTLLIDMDGVMADLYQHCIELEYQRTGVRLEMDALRGIPELDAFPRGHELVREPGFFRNMPVMKDAQQVVAALNEAYSLFIVSAAMEFPNSLREKYDWLQEHFSFISWRQIILCGSKTPVNGDILIDDHFKNLDPFQGRTLLFDQPHSAHNHNHRHQRVHHWKEIEAVLLA